MCKYFEVSVLKGISASYLPVQSLYYSDTAFNISGEIFRPKIYQASAGMW